MNMEPRRPVPNSGTESATAITPKQIVEVHSPLTAKMMPKKFDALNQPRPVLHKYSAEQVEVVYHRRSGDEVVSRPVKVPSEPVKTTPKRNSKKRNDNPDPTSTSAIKTEQINHSNGESVSRLDLSRAEPQESGTEEIIVASSGCTSETADGLGDISMAKPGHENLSCNELDESHAVTRNSQMSQNDISDCANAFLLNKVNELTQFVNKILLEMSEMQLKLNKLENDNMEIVRSNNILQQQYLNHIRNNSMVASEMKRLKTLLNKSEATVSHHDVNALLARARFSRTGKENGMCSMKKPFSIIIKPESLSSVNSDIKEVQGDSPS